MKAHITCVVVLSSALFGCALRQPVDFFEAPYTVVVGGPAAAPLQVGAGVGGSGAPVELRDEVLPQAEASASDDMGTTREDDANMRDAQAAPLAAQSADGPLRALVLRLSGMDDELGHFTSVRVADAEGEVALTFVIHGGLHAASSEWRLPKALVAGEAYTLDLFIDHDESTGPAFYDRPPADRAFRVAIPASDGEAVVELDGSAPYVDIEADAPSTAHSTVLSSSGMSDYRGRMYDVRLIDCSTGRLVGRQLREVPGDSFDLTVSSTTREGVEYEVAIAIDADDSGDYGYPADPSWRLVATAGEDGLRPSLDASADQVDVRF